MSKAAVLAGLNKIYTSTDITYYSWKASAIDPRFKSFQPWVRQTSMQYMQPWYKMLQKLHLMQFPGFRLLFSWNLVSHIQRTNMSLGRESLQSHYSLSALQLETHDSESHSDKTSAPVPKRQLLMTFLAMFTSLQWNIPRNLLLHQCSGLRKRLSITVKFAILSSYAGKIFCVQGTSVPIERVFGMKVVCLLNILLNLRCASLLYDVYVYN